MNTATAPLTFAVYEDRPRAMIGLKLLLASLTRHHPEACVQLFCPCADAAFERWIARRGRIELQRRPWARCGWSIKPIVLLDVLETGCPDVTWIDSDIIVTGKLTGLLHRDDPQAMVVLEETPWAPVPGGTYRTRCWGLPVGRSLPFTVNSGFIRVTPAHRELLVGWRELMQRPDYLQAQSIPYPRRPLHLRSDQDALEALLGSERFGGVRLHYLRCGVDVVQAIGPSGYAVGHRISSLVNGLPPLIHALGVKPWSLSVDQGLRARLLGWYEQVHQELSVYVHVARDYRDELEEDCPWMDVRTTAGRLCRALTGQHPALQGLPQAVVDTTARWLKRAVKALTQPAHPSPNA
ncbi:MAG: nucleotide-diphospho-sugar transferase [Phycisphaerae bacterium]|jgi:hypothetical protein|nr:nucleotide-diphospho-sugar transferase [Phycisphaerae bacterium]HOL24842.1 nucleotide-diphospho-sugar transferase [Phycisphaerae bacterium]HPP19378.1 nucleotide-diphospho-sugar transferase [Phycisphaerae bacterium]